MTGIDWSDWWLISVIAAIFLGIGAGSGFRAGAKALPLRVALGNATRNGVCAVIFGTTLLAVVVSHFGLWELGKWSETEASEYGLYLEHEPFISVHPEGRPYGLRLDYAGYWDRLSYPPGGCNRGWCWCARCTPRHPRELDGVVNDQIARGAIWAFLAPMWTLFGSVPLLGAAALGHSFGIGRGSFTSSA